MRIRLLQRGLQGLLQGFYNIGALIIRTGLSGILCPNQLVVEGFRAAFGALRVWVKGLRVQGLGGSSLS